MKDLKNSHDKARGKTIYVGDMERPNKNKLEPLYPKENQNIVKKLLV